MFVCMSVRMVSCICFSCKNYFNLSVISVGHDVTSSTSIKKKRVVKIITTTIAKSCMKDKSSEDAVRTNIASYITKIETNMQIENVMLYVYIYMYTRMRFVHRRSLNPRPCIFLVTAPSRTLSDVHGI